MAAARPSPTIPLLNISEPTENDSHRDEDDTGRGRRVLSDPSKWNWRNIFAVLAIWLAYVFINAAYSTMAPFFPNKAAEKGSTPATTGVIISCAPLCVFLFAPVFGYWLPKIGLKFMLLLGLFFVGGSYVILGFAVALPSGWVFIIFCVLLRLIEGTGSAMFITAFFSLLQRLYPNNMGLVMALVEVGAGLGYTTGLPMGGLLYTIGGFKLPFLVVGGICLVYIPLIFLLLKHASTTQPPPLLRSVAKLMCNFTAILLVTSNILTWATATFFQPILAPFLTSQFHLNELQVGLAFLASPGAYMLSAPVVGRLCDKLGPRYLIISGGMISGIGFFFVGPAHFITQPMLWLTILARGIIGIGNAMGQVAFYSDLLGIGKSLNIDDQGSLFEVIAGVTASSYSFGEFIGPILGGALTEMMDFQTSAVVVGEVALAQACLLLGATVINKIIIRMGREKNR